MQLRRHSAVWVDQQKQLCIRLRVRKNRPQGSLLRRPCSCPVNGRQMCVVHRTQGHLCGRAQGTKLFTSTPAQMLASLRSILASLHVEHPEEYTLKTFRAGHATVLASEGKSIGTILQAGEWRSAAFLSYVDLDVVDASQFLEDVLDTSDAE